MVVLLGKYYAPEKLTILDMLGSNELWSVNDHKIACKIVQNQ